MKDIFKVLFVLLLFIPSFIYAWSLGFDSSPQVNIDCGWGNRDNCNLKTWVDLVKNEINGIEQEKNFSEYIQKLVLYAISFVSFIALIYIVYSGFVIIFSGWDDEKLKNSKKTILYVILWIALIWMAYPITMFIINIFN